MAYVNAAGTIFMLSGYESAGNFWLNKRLHRKQRGKEGRRLSLQRSI
jgi:hypothetical protein